MKSHEALREEPRAWLYLPASLKTQGKELEVKVRNISSTGILIESKLFTTYPHEKSLQISIRLFPGFPPLILNTECVWRSEKLSGLRITNSSSLARHSLKKMIHYHLK